MTIESWAWAWPYILAWSQNPLASALWWPSLKQLGQCCRLSCTHMVFAHGDFKGKTLQAPWSCHLLIEMCKKPGRLHGKQHMLRETLEHSMSDELASS